jgi:hypothetical protein
LNAYSTNLANIEAMRKEIARLNELARAAWMVRLKQVTRRWMNQKGLNSSKGDIPRSSTDSDTQKEPRQMEERL